VRLGELAQPAADRAQHAIAELVPQAIIDGLEVVDVDE
jgi:hypothetical protein